MLDILDNKITFTFFSQRPSVFEKKNWKYQNLHDKKSSHQKKQKQKHKLLFARGRDLSGEPQKIKMLPCGWFYSLRYNSCTSGIIVEDGLQNWGGGHWNKAFAVRSCFLKMLKPIPQKPNWPGCLYMIWTRTTTVGMLTWVGDKLRSHRYTHDYR